MKKLTQRAWISGPLAVAFLVFWTPTDDGPTLCPFALITGHACPGCGMTRALAFLVRGDFDSALVYHPLAPLLAIAVIAGAIWWAGQRRGRWPAISVKAINVALTVAGVMLLGVWLGRIAAGTLPPV